jgi:hypothetical protein
MAERFADAMGQQFNESFDFTPESLARLDGCLTEWRDLAGPYLGQDPRELLEMAIPLAAYVGEVIRRARSDAVWITEQEPEQIAPPHLRLGDGLRVNLVKPAMHALTGASKPAFATYFQTIHELEQAGERTDQEPDGQG